MLGNNDNSPLVLRYIRMKEMNDVLRCGYQSKLVAMKSLVERLGLECELEGHAGCVNCLEWNREGSILASGSDDLQIILWDPFRHKKMCSIDTGHQGNIFSVKFMPLSKDGLLASGAGDGKVKTHWVERCGSAPNDSDFRCTCHTGRVKRLATAPDLPYLFWSGAEDGTVIQHDLRAPHECNSSSSNILINLPFHCGSQAEVKSIAINPLRSEQLAVGANDPYVRLYDRRKIRLTSASPQSSWGRQNGVRSLDGDNKCSIPADCVQYFVPGHIPCKLEDYRRRFRSLASTYVSFDPTGRYLLAYLGGEQLYLYDCVVPNEATTHLPSSARTNELTEKMTVSEGQKDFTLGPKVEHLKSLANARFKQQQYIIAVGLYSKALLLEPNASVLYSNRAAALMKRNWDGDIYAALRDCCAAIELDSNQAKPYLRMARCLQDLGWSESSLEVLDLFKRKFPCHSNGSSVRTLDKEIKISLGHKTTSNRTLDASAGDKEAHESRTREDGPLPPSITTLEEIRWRDNAWDYASRYCGHCNTTTDIKEANFFGSDGEFIIAGSDDGCILVWDRKTGVIERILRGDDSIVNCLQPHPFNCLLATSGIDSVVRLWSPLPQDGRINDRVVVDTEAAALANQRRMNADPFEMILMNLGAEETSQGVPSGNRGRGRLLGRLGSPNASDDDDNEAHAAVQCRPS